MPNFMTGKKVVVLLGAGGVGKTSTAIALAIAAARKGRSVGLLSIDPAKRLAAALGLDLGGRPKRLDLGLPADAGFVEAAMLDQKQVFDRMVERYATDPLVKRKILSHSLYIAASTKLAGSLEYMALANLQEMVESSVYDLIVLDTPPDTNALDFLRKPNVLAGFMDEGVMHWMVKPFHVASRLGLGKIFSVGERLMGGVAKVTGISALTTLTEFLVLIQTVIDGFHAASLRVVTTLGSSSTGFVLVTTATKAAERSARNLGDQLVSLGYPLSAVIFNRSLPNAVLAEVGNGPEWESVPALKRLSQRSEQERDLRTSLTQHLQAIGKQPVESVVIEEQNYDLHQIAAMVQFSHAFV